MIYDEVKYIRRKHIDLVVRTAESVREHFHQEIELIYILSGTMVLHVGEQTSLMEAEDICVINANRKHGYTTSEDVLFVRVSVTSSSGPGVSAQEENISAAATSNNTPLIVLFLLFIPYVRFF